MAAAAPSGIGRIRVRTRAGRKLAAAAAAFPLVLSLALALSACTGQLRASTAAVSATLPSLLDEQFLDNIAVFLDQCDGKACNAVPIVFVYNEAAIRITGVFTPAYKLPFHFGSSARKFREADAGASFTWDEQWILNPASSQKDIHLITEHLTRLLLDGTGITRGSGCPWLKRQGAAQTDAWLCVDPDAPPTGAVSSKWRGKGRYRGHDMWVNIDLYYDKLIDFTGLPEDAAKQTRNPTMLMMEQMNSTIR